MEFLITCFVTNKVPWAVCLSLPTIKWSEFVPSHLYEENSLKYYTIKIPKAFKYLSDVSDYDTLNGQAFYLFCVTVLVGQDLDAGL